MGHHNGCRSDTRDLLDVEVSVNRCTAQRGEKLNKWATHLLLHRERCS